MPLIGSFEDRFPGGCFRPGSVCDSVCITVRRAERMGKRFVHESVKQNSIMKIPKKLIQIRLICLVSLVAGLTRWGCLCGRFAGPIIQDWLKRGRLQFFAFCCLILSAFVFSNSAKAGQYFEDFSSYATGSTPNFANGAKLFSTALGGTASVVDATYMELQLTASSIGNTRSALLLPDLDPGTPIYAFSAKWNMDIYGGFPNAGNGFSFNFGQLEALDLINSAYAQESGYSTGLCFSVQTSTSPGFYLRANGSTVASQSYAPATQWGINNTTRHFFEMDWNYTNGLTIRMDGQTIFTNVVPDGFIPRSGDRFVWAARTRGSSEEVRLDNIVVMTGGNLALATTTSAYYQDGNTSDAPAQNAFDGNLNSFWSTYAASGFAGATVFPASEVQVYALTSSLATDRSSDPQNWTLQSSNNGGANWSSVGTGSGYFINPWETRCWITTTAAASRAYRLNISQNNGNSAVTRLGELQ